ncbi:MAG TPA: host attachment protein, partial [Burkholderiales bacterium]
SDQLGRRSHSRGRAGTPMQASADEPHQTPAEHEAERFARSVAETLARGRADGRYGRLVLTAAPEFLGMLRGQLDPRVASLVKFEVDRDYTRLDAAGLRARIAELVP